MDIRIVKEKINTADIENMAKEGFGDMVKAVVDIERRIMAIGGELHADAEAVLLDDGSEQKNIWGINVYPDKSGDEMVRFTSMINIRPTQGNRSRDIQLPEVKEKIQNILKDLIIP